MTIDVELLEQLSAWTDGELPADQARFLQRRLDADPALRARWERWQIASACLRGQPVREMPAKILAYKNSRRAPGSRSPSRRRSRGRVRRWRRTIRSSRRTWSGTTR